MLEKTYTLKYLNGPTSLQGTVIHMKDGEHNHI